jgi:hypothetical protein
MNKIEVHDANIVLAVSGLTECLAKFLREHEEYYCNDKEPVRLRQEMYIEIWATEFIAACASSGGGQFTSTIN